MAKSEKTSAVPDGDVAVMAAAETESPPRLSKLAVVLTLAFFIGWYGFYWHAADCIRVFCVSSVDTFWIIQAGRDILANGRLPAGDIYSYTNFGHPWVLYQWLFEVVGGVADKFDGLRGVQVLVDFIDVLIFPVCLLQGLIKRGVPYWIALLTGTFAVAASYPFLTWRPHLVSLFMVYLIYRLCDGFWREGGRRIFWLLPLFTLWANIHMVFPLGLVIVATYAGSSLVLWGLNRRKPELSRQYAEKFRWLALVLFLCLLATLVNPYGWHLYTYGWGTANSGFWKGTIGEAMAPQFDDPVGAMIAGYILLSIVAVLVSGKRPSLPDGLIYVGLLAAGLTSWKMLPYFVSGTMHATGLRLAGGLELIPIKWPRLLREVTYGIGRGILSPIYTIGLLALGVIFGLTHDVLLPPWVPQEAAEYIETHQLPQKIFCAAKFGSYMIYRTNGHFPVFIDNRFDMYGPEFSDRYFVATGFGIGWVDIVKQYGIQTAFVESDTGIARLLWASPDWRLVYSDGRAMIFVRDKEDS